MKINSLFENKEFIKLTQKVEKCKKKHCKKEYKEFHNNIDKGTKNIIKKCSSNSKSLNKKCLTNELKKQSIKSKDISNKYTKCIQSKCNKEIKAAKKMFS